MTGWAHGFGTGDYAVVTTQRRSPLSTDDIALLKQMRDSGEIDEEQYEALRRHVLWGTPLPELLEDLPGSEPTAAPPPTTPPPSGRRFTPNLPSGPARPQGEKPADTGPNRPFQPRPAQPRPTPPTPSRPTPNQPSTHPTPTPSRPTPAQSTPVQSKSAQPKPVQSTPSQPRPTRPTPPAPPRPAPGEAPPRVPVPVPTAATPPAGRRKWPYLLGAAVLVVIIVGGTAGWWFFLRDDDGGVKPADYAAAVCPAISSWRSDILTAGEQLGHDLDQADGRTDQQRIAKKFYSDAATRTDALIPKLEKVQAPNGSDNEEYATELADAARTADDRFHNLAAQVEELEPAGKATFKAALQILTGHPDGPLQAVTALLTKGRPPADIDQAFAADSGCQDLR